ncbi:uncharacterized protein LOC116214612 [Punica granatum]|uniref:Uncharacterized protein LOC116214612 n=2 Tax=Punica granatum TaxID=22663 RepID=A0A6P8EJK4_PUNGR|nr:uncharacterized protein LOC116214612 [Punica granatum]PKI59183.1 hypothetical protein CRG98_020448 [Punica granatum]
MAGFIRTKRVTGPIHDRVRARLIGHISSASSGSEADQSPCLSELVYGFLEEDVDGEPETTRGYLSDSDRAGSPPDSTDAIEKVLEQWAKAVSLDSYRNLLQDHILEAMKVFPSGMMLSGAALLRQRVVVFLQKSGHNAAVCKTRWESSGSLTAGNYEFIDVVMPGLGGESRYLIDLDFASQFEIARPTSQYSRLLQTLPRVFIGQGDVLKAIVKEMSRAAKRSLKSRGLSVPPWRKSRYMQNKWLSPYHQTVNPVPATVPVNANIAVPCCWVGFDDAVDGRLVLRTR